MKQRFAAFVILVACASLATAAHAGQCRLDHAIYAEPTSGATIAFRPKDKAADANLTTGLFTLQLPHIEIGFPGDITWNAGSNARPDGVVAHACAADESVDGEACVIWTGNVYVLGNATASLVDDADMPAPAALLFSDFGRSLVQWGDFVRANPDRPAFDVFSMTGCKP